MFRKEFYILGDGETNTLTVDLEAAPVAMNFVGKKYPAAAFPEQDGVELSIDGTLLTFAFPSAPAKNSVNRVRATFYY